MNIQNSCHTQKFRIQNQSKIFVPRAYTKIPQVLEIFRSKFKANWSIFNFKFIINIYFLLFCRKFGYPATVSSCITMNDRLSTGQVALSESPAHRMQVAEILDKIRHSFPPWFPAVIFTGHIYAYNAKRIKGVVKKGSLWMFIFKGVSSQVYVDCRRSTPLLGN